MIKGTKLLLLVIVVVSLGNILCESFGLDFILILCANTTFFFLNIQWWESIEDFDSKLIEFSYRLGLEEWNWIPQRKSKILANTNV